MPVLRYPNEPNFAGQLNSIGDALANAWNPKTRAEAYLLQQRMMLEQFQLQQEQRKQQAVEGAVQQYGHLVPPEYMPEITRMIYTGASHADIIKAVAGYSGKLVDDPSDAGTAKNIAFMNSLDPSSPWKELYPPVAGPLTQKHRQDIEAMQAGAVAGQEEAGKQLAQQQVKMSELSQLVDDPSKNEQNLQHWRAAGQPEPTNGIVIAGDRTAELSRNTAVTQKGAETAATVSATQANTPIDLTKPQLWPHGIPGGPASAPGAVTAAPGAASTAAPAVTQQPVTVPNPSAPYAPPATVVRQTPSGVITGVPPAEQKSTEETGTARQAQLQTAIDEGVTAKMLTNKLGQLRELSAILGSGGLGGQWDAGMIKKIYDATGRTVGSRAEAYAAMDQILNTEIPDLRKAAGIQRLAGPEISSIGKTIGSASMAPGVLNNIIANEQSAADLQIKRRDLAQRAMGTAGAPLSFDDYTALDNANIDQIKKHTDELRTQYGAVGTRPEDKPYAGPPNIPVVKDTTQPEAAAQPGAKEPPVVVAKPAEAPAAPAAQTPLPAFANPLTFFTPSATAAPPAPPQTPAPPAPPEPAKPDFIFRNGQIIEQ